MVQTPTDHPSGRGGILRSDDHHPTFVDGSEEKVRQGFDPLPRDQSLLDQRLQPVLDDTEAVEGVDPPPLPPTQNDRSVEQNDLLNSRIQTGVEIGVAPCTEPRPTNTSALHHHEPTSIRRNSYCALATASADGRPHVVGVLYAFARGTPPFSIQFHGSARILNRDDAEIEELLREGLLRRIVGHGVLERPGMCFVKVVPVGKLHTWGIGVSPWQLLRDPVGADRSVELR